MNHQASAGRPPGVNGRSGGRILITGGCGFIGSNMASRYLARDWEVVAYDNFSRPGSKKNAHWLEGHRGGGLKILREDIRDFQALTRAMEDVDVVAHLAAQV